MTIFSNSLRLLFLAILVVSTPIQAASPRVFSEKLKSDATKLLIDSKESVSSPEEKYQIFRSLEVLGAKHEDPATCKEVIGILASSSSPMKDVFYAAKILEVLRCPFVESDANTATSNAKSHLSNQDSLLDLHFSIGTLNILKKSAKHDLVLENAVDILNAVKALGQEDGTWKYSRSEDGSSSKATGIAMQIVADLVSITGSAIDSSLIRPLKTAALKLFESIEKYEDGTHYFTEKPVDGVVGFGGSLAATSYVVKGLTACAPFMPGNVKIPAEKIIGVANLFLSASIGGSSADTFYVLDALNSLDANSFAVPLVTSLSSEVLSLTHEDVLEVSITTVLGSPIGSTVTLTKVVKQGQRKPILTNQVLDSDANKITHTLDLAKNNIDLGKYTVYLQVVATEEGNYVLENPSTREILVTGIVSVENVEVGVLDTDTGSPDVMKKWDPSSKASLSLFATHLQKLQFSLDIVSPLKEEFQPHQVFVRLTHESKIEHLFLLKHNGKHFDLSLDLLGLVEKKLKYLSGVYTIELIIGDDSMENPLMSTLGTVELDLPEPPEGFVKPTPVPEVTSKYGPKSEIVHIFRQAEKRAPSTLSNTFLVLTLLPLLGFLVGIKMLDVNMKNFPKSGLPMIAALLFHVGIASILGLYVMFWLKLNLFQTLKLLGVLGALVTVPGYYALSYLADSSTKMKTA